MELCIHWYPLHTHIYSPRCQNTQKLGVFIIFWTFFEGGSKVENDESDDVPLTFTRNPVGACMYMYGAWEIRAGFSLMVQNKWENSTKDALRTKAPKVENEIK